MRPEIWQQLLTSPAFTAEVYCRMSLLGQRWMALANLLGDITLGRPIQVEHVPFVLGASREINAPYDASTPALLPVDSLVTTARVLALMRLIEAARVATPPQAAIDADIACA